MSRERKPAFPEKKSGFAHETMEMPSVKSARPGTYPCPCCGCRTFPAPPEEAVSYICPVCMWENDVFLASTMEPSDENHGLSLTQGQENYRTLGVCDPRLVRHAHKPTPEELTDPGES